jgi:HD-GYP domain-containing protein (c-di-GMP phosphodiesterase class II)
MVRFIDIIRREQEPQDNNGDARKRQDDHFGAGREAQSGRPLAGVAEANASASAEMQELYYEVLLCVRGLINKIEGKSAITEEDIFPVVTRLADAFIKDHYNQLLLFSYTYSKDDYLVAHIANVVILTVGFSRSLGYERDDILKIGVCSLCHDLGMVEHSALVNKKKGLRSGDRRRIKDHPLRSVALVKEVLPEDLCSIIKEIHERENGRGAPEGLRTHEISVWAKIIALCDVYEALTHPRIHRPFYDPHQALRKIIEMKKDGLFDESCVKKFIEFLAVYPVGTFVRLSTGDTAMVIRANHEFVTKPVVEILVNADGDVPLKTRIIDLAHNSLVTIERPLEREHEREVVTVLQPRGEPVVVI